MTLIGILSTTPYGLSYFDKFNLYEGNDVDDVGCMSYVHVIAMNPSLYHICVHVYIISYHIISSLSVS